MNASNDILEFLKNLTQLSYINNTSNSLKSVNSIPSAKKYSGNFMSTFMNSDRTFNTPQSSNNNLIHIDLDKLLSEDNSIANITNMITKFEEGGISNANNNFLSLNSLKTLRELQQLNYLMKELSKCDK
jgi:hypothetical protein